MDVITLGELLVDSYYKMVHELRVASLRGEEWMGPVKAALQEFDEAWVSYEQVPLCSILEVH